MTFEFTFAWNFSPTGHFTPARSAGTITAKGPYEALEKMLTTYTEYDQPYWLVFSPSEIDGAINATLLKVERIPATLKITAS